jgi:hypothetical protein
MNCPCADSDKKAGSRSTNVGGVGFGDIFCDFVQLLLYFTHLRVHFLNQVVLSPREFLNSFSLILNTSQQGNLVVWRSDTSRESKQANKPVLVPSSKT